MEHMSAIATRNWLPAPMANNWAPHRTTCVVNLPNNPRVTIHLVGGGTKRTLSPAYPLTWTTHNGLAR